MVVCLPIDVVLGHFVSGDHDFPAHAAEGGLWLHVFVAYAYIFIYLYGLI